MFNKVKESIDTKIQEYKMENQRIEAENAAFDAECKKNREIVEARQKKEAESMKCPLCQNNTFFKNIRIAYTGYTRDNCPVYITLKNEEGLSSTKQDPSWMPVSTCVCKKCGNIIQKMDFSYLDDFSFRDADREYTLIPPVQW